MSVCVKIVIKIEIKKKKNIVIVFFCPYRTALVCVRVWGGERVRACVFERERGDLSECDLFIFVCMCEVNSVHVQIYVCEFD